jgi:hypothetical protein
LVTVTGQILMAVHRECWFSRIRGARYQSRRWEKESIDPVCNELISCDHL